MLLEQAQALLENSDGFIGSTLVERDNHAGISVPLLIDDVILRKDDSDQWFFYFRGKNGGAHVDCGGCIDYLYWNANDQRLESRFGTTWTVV